MDISRAPAAGTPAGFPEEADHGWSGSPLLAVLVAAVLLGAGVATVLAPAAVASALVGPTLFLAVFCGLARLLV